MANQGAVYDRFDAVVLLSAPVDVILDRVADRANPFGSTAEDRTKIAKDLDGGYCTSFSIAHGGGGVAVADPAAGRRVGVDQCNRRATSHGSTMSLGLFVGPSARRAPQLPSSPVDPGDSHRPTGNRASDRSTIRALSGLATDVGGLTRRAARMDAQVIAVLTHEPNADRRR